MYIYNVTINVEDSVRDTWLHWMEQTHIPDMLATGKFRSARICRVLVEEQTGGTTYAVQYTAHSRGHLEQYYQEDAPRLREDSLRRFGDKCLAFRTELEILSEHA